MSRIKQARRRLGLTQVELASAAGVSPATVTEVELGKRQPQGRTMRKLATALGVEVADLVEEEEATAPKDQTPPDSARPIYDLAWESLNRQAAQQAANQAFESIFAQLSSSTHKDVARILSEQYPQAEIAAAYVDLMESYLEAKQALQERQRAPDEAGKSSQ